MCSSGVERNAETLLRASNSVLLLQHVLKSKAGKAFSKVISHQLLPLLGYRLKTADAYSSTAQVLVHLQKGSPDLLLNSFGEWYGEIAASGHASWQDLLLDEASPHACVPSAVDLKLSWMDIAYPLHLCKTLACCYRYWLGVTIPWPKLQQKAAWGPLGRCTQPLPMTWTSCNGSASQRAPLQVCGMNLRPSPHICRHSTGA